MSPLASFLLFVFGVVCCAMALICQAPKKPKTTEFYAQPVMDRESVFEYHDLQEPITVCSGVTFELLPDGKLVVTREDGSKVFYERAYSEQHKRIVWEEVKP